MLSPKQANAHSTPKKVSCKGFMPCPKTVTTRCTPTTKTAVKLYNKPSSLT